MKLVRSVRPVLLLIAFALIAAFGYIAFEGPQGISALEDKRGEIRKLEEENANLQREVQYRRERIKKLQESPSEQELEVRKNLKLLRPGETSFILPDRPKPEGSKPASPSEPPAAP